MSRRSRVGVPGPDEYVHTTSVWWCRLRYRWHLPVPMRTYCGLWLHDKPAKGSPSCPDCDRILVAAGVTLLSASTTHTATEATEK